MTCKKTTWTRFFHADQLFFSLSLDSRLTQLTELCRGLRGHGAATDGAQGGHLIGWLRCHRHPVVQPITSQAQTESTVCVRGQFQIKNKQTHKNVRNLMKSKQLLFFLVQKVTTNNAVVELNYEGNNLSSSTASHRPAAVKSISSSSK